MNEALESGKGGYLARPPHTTWHAGPHQAVHEKEAHGGDQA